MKPIDGESVLSIIHGPATTGHIRELSQFLRCRIDVSRGPIDADRQVSRIRRAAAARELAAVAHGQTRRPLRAVRRPRAQQSGRRLPSARLRLRRHLGPDRLSGLVAQAGGRPADAHQALPKSSARTRPSVPMLFVISGGNLDDDSPDEYPDDGSLTRSMAKELVKFSTWCGGKIHATVYGYARSGVARCSSVDMCALNQFSSRSRTRDSAQDLPKYLLINDDEESPAHKHTHTHTHSGRIITRRGSSARSSARALYTRLTEARSFLKQTTMKQRRIDSIFMDNTGLTHFHVACSYGLENIVEKFIELGQCPYYHADTLLLQALEYGREKVIEKMLNYYPELVNAQDEEGNPLLHVALGRRAVFETAVIELLLERGADPNLANAKGWTPLHLICADCWDDDAYVKTFFEIADRHNKTVEVDAKDELGRTPLQWAVARLAPKIIDLLLDRGADLSSFVFPTEVYFAKHVDVEYGNLGNLNVLGPNWPRQKW
ncbi:unnamed protein product [Trichogramma brassicae]|uniref:Uncharacterized protein n=1 Tax=Trichogramma brassicae TaxID=86971 RepID=A0A6H5HZH8_9HYME|nr:unnamed protein product [Trichogramma brassicae]